MAVAALQATPVHKHPQVQVAVAVGAVAGLPQQAQREPRGLNGYQPVTGQVAAAAAVADLPPLDRVELPQAVPSAAGPGATASQAAAL